jgi:hypothetical protein
MPRLPTLRALAGLCVVLPALGALATVPSSVEITCDVKRAGSSPLPLGFKQLAATASPAEVTFRFWNAASGGSQCGGDHVVPMSQLAVFKRHTDRYDGVLTRKAARITAVLASPTLCSGSDTWVDVVVNGTTLGCDFSATGDSTARRKLSAVPFASECQACTSAQSTQDISARVCHTGVLTVADSTNTAVPFDTERWDTDSIHDTVTNNTRLTATTAGKYLIFGHVGWVGTTSGFRQVAIYRNGDPVAIQNQPATASLFSISTHHQLSQGDYVELFVLQSSGGPVGISDGCPPNPQNYTNDFGMVKLP